MTLREAYISNVEAQIDEWNEEIARLRQQVPHPTFQQHLEALAANIEVIDQKLDELKRLPTGAWEVAKVDVEDGVIVVRENFDRTRREFEEGAYGNPPEADSEGWVEGMGHQEHDSEGWVEGMGHQEHDSEGWVEGMGHQEHDSEGWSEGMDEAVKSR